jgi:hypothetical protein
MNRSRGPWNRTYIYRLLCGRNSGLQGMTCQLLLQYLEPLIINLSTIVHGPPVTVFKQPRCAIFSSTRICIKSCRLRNTVHHSGVAIVPDIGYFSQRCERPQAICGYNSGKSESGRLTLTSLLNIGRQFILTAFDIHYYLKQECYIP